MYVVQLETQRCKNEDLSKELHDAEVGPNVKQAEWRAKNFFAQVMALVVCPLCNDAVDDQRKYTHDKQYLTTLAVQKRAGHILSGTELRVPW